MKHSCALWALIIPWVASPRFWSALSSQKHTLLQDGGKWGERSSTSVMEQEVLEQTALHTATASNMWTRLMCSCCGPDIDSPSSQGGAIYIPAVVHSSVALTCMFFPKFYKCQKGVFCFYVFVFFCLFFFYFLFF